MESTLGRAVFNSSFRTADDFMEFKHRVYDSHLSPDRLCRAVRAADAAFQAEHRCMDVLETHFELGSWLEESDH